MSGNSMGERPCWRTQPQLRPDCSPAIRPFSNRATDTPCRARKYAVETPTMPPPTITTSAEVGSGFAAAFQVHSSGRCRLTCCSPGAASGGFTSGASNRRLPRVQRPQVRSGLQRVWAIGSTTVPRERCSRVLTAAPAETSAGSGLIPIRVAWLRTGSGRSRSRSGQADRRCLRRNHSASRSSRSAGPRRRCC